MGTAQETRRVPGWVPGWARHAWTEPGGRWRPSTRDIAIAAVATIIAVVAAYGEAHPTDPSAYFTNGHHLPHTPTAALLLVVLAGAALAWRHRYPRLVVGVATAAVVAYSLPGYVNGVALLLPAIALVTVATGFPVRQSLVWALAVTIVLMAATGPSNPLGFYGGSFWLIPANNAVALFVGIAIANRSYVHSARAQAARQAALDAQRRVEEERLRIARELHDVVAHTMATITVQAAAATQLLRDRPDDAAESLKAIRAASKDGLRELRAILDVLRTAGGGDEPVDPTQPTPGLSRLDALLAGVRAAGLRVDLTVTGRPRDLPAVTDLAAFRIIQEALTNTLRHRGLRRGRPPGGGHRHGPRPHGLRRRGRLRGVLRQRGFPRLGTGRLRQRPGWHAGGYRRPRAARHARARRGGGRHDRHRPAAGGRFPRRGAAAA
jgi:signal transduction histidine kinase